MKLFRYLVGCFLFMAGTSHAQQEASSAIAPHTVITKKYSIQPFTTITSNMMGQLRIVAGEQHKVEAKGTFETIELLYIVSKDGVLEISINKERLTTQKLKNSQLTITVTTPTLTQISNQGVSNIRIEGDFLADNLTLESKGVGNIQADNLVTKELTVTSDGVGSIKLTGSSEQATYDSKGVGSIDAKGLKTKNTTVLQKGIGSISCYAAEAITIQSKGIGSITYYGNPLKKTLHKKGIGSITAK